MRNPFTILWITLILPWSQIFADRHDGGTVGNGGYGVMCSIGGSSEPRVTVYDFFEGERRYGLKASLGEPQLSPIEKISRVLDQLARLDPDRAARYHKELAKFEANTAMWPDAHLPLIPDLDPVALPGDGCRLVVVARQKKPEKPGEKFYTIDESLWNLMPNDDRAGIILHEIIYTEALHLGQVNSTNTRFLTATFASSLMETMSFEEYRARLQSAQFPLPTTHTVDGIPFELGSVEFYPDGAIKSGTVVKSVQVPAPVAVEGGVLWASKNSRLEFHQNGQVKSIETNVAWKMGPCIQRLIGRLEISEEGLLIAVETSPNSMNGPPVAPGHSSGASPTVGFCVPYPDGSVAFVHLVGRKLEDSSRMRFEFWESGVVKEGTLGWHYRDAVRMKLPNPHYPHPYPVEYDVLYVHNQEKVPFLAGSKIAFHPTGFASRGMIASTMALTTTMGKKKYFAAKSILDFDDEGRVVVKP